MGWGLRQVVASVGVAFGACLLVGASATGPTVAHADPAQVLIVGDSLAVGMRPFLGALITDRQVRFDVRAGWTTPQGMEALRVELEQYAPQTVVISLGSNDGSDAKVFASRVRRVLRGMPRHSCVVWPAIMRPKRKGDYRGLNRVLRDEARRDRRLTVINWDRMVLKGQVTLRDGLHPDEDGYRWRAWVTAGAVQRGCRVATPA